MNRKRLDSRAIARAQSSYLVRKNAQQRILSPALRPKLNMGRLSRWRAAEQLLLDDSKPLSAQPLAPNTYRAVVASADTSAAPARAPLFVGFAFFHCNKSHIRQHIRLHPQTQQRLQILLDAIHSMREVFKRCFAVCFQMGIPIELGNYTSVDEGRKGQSSGKDEWDSRFGTEAQRPILQVMVGQRDPPAGFEYRRNSPRKIVRNTKFYFVIVADPCLACRLCSKLECAG